MKERLKQISRIVLAVALLIGGWYLTSLVYNLGEEHHHNSLPGALIGLILIGFYQQKYANGITYRFRYPLNALAVGLGCLIWAIPDLLIYYLFSKPFLFLAMEFSFGLIFGALLSYYQYFTGRRQAKILKYTGAESPVISGNARLIHFGNSSSGPGRAFLLRDKILFLSRYSDNSEVYLKDIKHIEIGKLLGFPNRLILLLDDAESITMSVPMPYYWKKKIVTRDA